MRAARGSLPVWEAEHEMASWFPFALPRGIQSLAKIIWIILARGSLRLCATRVGQEL